ncbi:DUF3325 family protein [Sphingomonas pituitosa]|uniref:DUF3325 family protein n=1 Tax=Sphingomonas pituitosa TaxID=99597 RepID=UPI00082B6821|nr:DUF3325 family protein [Sphingomonas pituitosa]
MIAAGLTLIGFFALAAAMPRHAPLLLGGWQSRLPPQRLQAAGWVLLLAAFAATLLAPDWPRGLVTWLGLLPLAAALVLLGLTYDVRIARGTAAAGLLTLAAGLLR